jgi:hypothetical protein
VPTAPAASATLATAASRNGSFTCAKMAPSEASAAPPLRDFDFLRAPGRRLI